MISTDYEITISAFSRVKELEAMYGDTIPWAAIKEGFNFSGENILLANQVQGIFKPRIMSRGPLSIKTTMPKGNNVNIYNDQLTDDGYYQYSLEKGDPYGERNVLLWQVYEDQRPFIYFHAVYPGVYKVLWPCFVQKIHPELGYAEISIGSQKSDSGIQDANYQIPNEIESRYMVRESKVRLHQASFRESVLSAYKHSCAITGLPVPKLLEAAHIISDKEIGDKQLINNGIALSRIHHKAYDSNLLGIDPDYKIHVSNELMIENGGIFLEKGILDFNGKKLNIPCNKDYQPSKEYLSRRFEKYKEYNY